MNRPRSNPLSGLLAVSMLALSALLAYPVISPMLKELQATVDECARTPAAKRTEAQRKRCEPRPSAGFVIPGVL